MKIAAFSDLHAHLYEAHAKILAGGTNSRLQDCIEALKAIVAYCTENAIRVIVFGGDLYHVKGEIKVPAFNRIHEIIAQAHEMNWLMIPGNHDFANEDGAEHALETFKALPHVRVFDTPWSHTEVDGSGSEANFVFIPFIRDRKKLEEAIAGFEKPLSPRLRILVAHQYTHELMRKYTGRDGDLSAEDLARRFDLVLLGHHHVHDIIVTAGGRKVVSIGAPLQHTFGERGFKTGFVVVDTESLEVEHVPIKSPEFHAFTSLDEMAGTDATGDFVRVRVTGKREAEKARKILEDAGAASIAIEIIPDAKEVRIDLEPGLADTEILQRYVDSEWGKSDLDSARLLEFGHTYLRRGAAVVGG